MVPWLLRVASNGSRAKYLGPTFLPEMWWLHRWPRPLRAQSWSPYSRFCAGVPALPTNLRSPFYPDALSIKWIERKFSACILATPTAEVIGSGVVVPCEARVVHVATVVVVVVGARAFNKLRDKSMRHKARSGKDWDACHHLDTRRDTGLSQLLTSESKSFSRRVNPRNLLWALVWALTIVKGI